MKGRDAVVSFFRPDSLKDVEEICPSIIYDNGAFSFWQQAMKRGEEWDDKPRDWSSYYRWLECRISPERRAVIPDMPGAPSQLNDSLINDWPYGRDVGIPLWHMDGPIARLGSLCDQFDTVALGWIGHPKKFPVGCDDYRDRMDEVGKLFGNSWPKIHMMRGILVAFDYQFDSADSTSLAQNGWRYDSPIETFIGDQWKGRRAYADRLERGHGISHGQAHRSLSKRGNPRTHLDGDRLL
jgi:hypothetical protein